MSLSAKIGILGPYNADFYNRFYLIFLKNEINHCIEGITQCRPTHHIRMKVLTEDHARGAQPIVIQHPTQTSCSPCAAGGFHN